MSQLSGHSTRDPSPSSSPTNELPNPLRATKPHRNSTPIRPPSPIHPSSPVDTPVTNSPKGRNRSNSGRPLSIVQTFQPPLMDVSDDTIPELQPIFTFLNSHSNKLYQEGYFLKLDDQNTRMPNLILPRLRTTFMSLTRSQMGGPTQIALGQNALRNLSVLYCPCGTRPSWMLLEKTAKCCPNSSI